MAGRIRAEDVALVKERTSIEDVVREHVTLRPAGVGSLKGLCPFHDEKSPSFHVRPVLGVWHCFGCNEGGDAISFVQKVDHLTFHEAVERLAAEGRGRAAVRGRRWPPARGRRPADPADRGAPDGRAVLRRAAARPARTRSPPSSSWPSAGSTGTPRPGSASATRRGSGEALSNHLRGRGFTDDELVTGGPVRPAAAAGSTTGSAAAWSGRSATSPVTPWGSAPGGCTTTTGSRRSTSTRRRARSTARPPSSTASTWPRRRSRETVRPSSSRATPT